MRRICFMAITAISLASPAQAQGPAPSEPLSLTCEGRGVYNERHSDDNGTIGNVLDDRDYYKRVETAGRISLKFGPSENAMRLSATLPGGGQRWVKLSKVEIEEGQIRARFSGGSLTIDRRSAEMEMVGYLAFSGTCKKSEAESQERKF
jgi:hypothetical protein